MSVKIQFRRDTAANWTSANPVLAEGEFGYETNTKKYKLGDGTTAWNSLAYSNLRSLDATSVLEFENTATPATPASDKANVYVKDIAGRMFLRIQGPSGLVNPLQTSFFQNNIIMINTNATSSITSIGNTVTSAGSISHPTPTPAYGYMTNFATAAAVNGTSGTGTNGTLFVRTTTATDAAGFFYYARLAFPDSTYDETGSLTGSRIFVGLTNQTMAVSVGADNPIGTSCGFFRRHTNAGAKDTNWQFITDDGAAINIIDTDLVFTPQKVYDFYIFCPPGGANIGWRIDNVSDELTEQGITTSNLPTAEVYLRAGFQLWTANAVARNIRMQRVYIESDR
jgi:hypothetical protein